MTKSTQDKRFQRLMILATCASILYILNRLLLIPTWSEVSFFSSYFGDILALPVYIPLSFYLGWKLGIIDLDFKLGMRHILAAVLIFSAIFEILLPRFGNIASGDPWDMLAYLTGGMVLFFVNFDFGEDRINPNKPIEKR